jgi:hypothetical protein
MADGHVKLILRTDRLTRVIDGHTIVDGISIEFPRGDVLAIVGRGDARFLDVDDQTSALRAWRRRLRRR